MGSRFPTPPHCKKCGGEHYYFHACPPEPPPLEREALDSPAIWRGSKSSPPDGLHEREDTSPTLRHLGGNRFVQRRPAA